MKSLYRIKTRGFTPTPKHEGVTLKITRGKSLVRGFTLVELLIIIGVVAILTIIIILVIDPAKLLAKSRDSRRFSDVTSLVTAMNLYLADNRKFSAEGPYLSTDGTNNDNRIKNNGTGWIPIDFSLVSSGAPMATLPLDPMNNTTYHYSFGANPIAKTYEIDCVFEHADYKLKQSSDGGNNSDVYEVGTDLTILP